MKRTIGLLLLGLAVVFLSGCNNDKDQFLDALKLNDWQKAQAILNKHPDFVHIHVKSGGTLLHSAVYYDSQEMLEFLIKNGINVNARSCDDNSSPLHYAASQGRLDMAAILLEKGANANSCDESLDTPLHDAAMYSAKEMIELLITYGAEIDAKNELDRTPLYYACVYREDDDDAVEVVRILLMNGADPNDKCSTDSSIIQIIIAYPDCYFKKAQVLEDFGAKMEMKTEEGVKVLSVKEYQEIVENNREYLQKRYEQENREYLKLTGKYEK